MQKLKQRCNKYISVPNRKTKLRTFYLYSILQNLKKSASQVREVIPMSVAMQKYALGNLKRGDMNNL